MKFMNVLLTAGALAMGAAACNNQPASEKDGTEKDAITSGIKMDPWGVHDNTPVNLYTLTNAKGTVVKITNYGGIVTAFETKDKHNNNTSIVVGFDSLGQYLQQPPYFGAIIGRYGNRIGGGKFAIGKDTYTLAKNDGENHLHGGVRGFDKVMWAADPMVDSLPSLTLRYLSKDGEEGYPGNLDITVRYTLSENDELHIVYDATTDKATPVNLTNHSYFNLSGDVLTSIDGHTLQIDADAYTPVDKGLIPTGELRSVADSPFDFRSPKTIGLDIAKVEGGYDHNWVLNNSTGAMRKVATLTDSTSGRYLEVHTTEPGLQFYSGNFLDGKFINHTGNPVNLRTALCLETQHFPDSPNKKEFPSTILEPGQKYHTETIYKVGISNQ